MSGSVLSLSNLIIAVSSKVIEVPVFSQVWLELDEFLGTNQGENAEFKQHESGKLAASFQDGRHRVSAYHLFDILLR
jgi:hypothetical protein